MKPENQQFLSLKIEDIQLRDHELYLGNRSLKRNGVKFNMTQEMVDEWKRCKNDILYFCKKYMKIVHVDHGLISFDPYPFQEEILNEFPNSRFNIVITARQAGKTTVNAAYILHYILFNKTKKVAIIANKGSTAREILDRIQNAYQNLPKWLQQGVIEWNKGSTSLENGCKVFTGSTTASSIRGQSINLLFIDEVAFIDSNLYEDFFNSVYPTISSGKTTQVCMVSTPNGMNHFYHLVKTAKANPTKFNLLTYDWRSVPTRDEAWAEEEKIRIGPERFKQEYECDFIGSETTLISMAALRSLKHETPIGVSSNGNMKIYEQPKEGRTYFASVDVSEGLKLDYSTISVIDVTEIPYRLVAVYRSNLVSPINFPVIIANIAKSYNEAYVLVEINSVGYSVAKDLIYDLEYENILYVQTDEEKSMRLGIKTTKKTKKMGCLRFKDLIESGILYVSDEDAIREMMTFVEKGNSYEADGLHDTDDIVMSLVNFSYFSLLPQFEEITNELFKVRFRESRKNEIEQDTFSDFYVVLGDEEEAPDVEEGFSDGVLTYRGDTDTNHFFM